MSAMPSDAYRHRVNGLAVVSSAAFFGCNLFIGLSLGSYWMSLEPLEFAREFWGQFTVFLYTVMPLFLLTLVGLVLSTRLDRPDPSARRTWQLAIGLYVATTVITLAVHVPENLRLRDPSYTAFEADAARRYWLLWHSPRVLLSLGIPILALRAIRARGAGTIRSHEGH